MDADGCAESTGFPVVVLPMGATSCLAYYLSHIKGLFLAALQRDQQHPFWRLLIHADNATVHTSKKVDDYFGSHGFRCGDHPPCSLDLASSDFFPVGFIKG
jgi:hypothetical protein